MSKEIKLTYIGGEQDHLEATKKIVEEALAYAISRAQPEYDPLDENGDVWPDPNGVRVEGSGNDAGATLFTVFVGALLVGVGQRLGERAVDAVWDYAEAYIARKHSNEVTPRT